MKHSFQDSLNHFRNCGLDIESTAYYLLHCPAYITEKRTLLNITENTDNNLLDLSETVLIKTLLLIKIHLRQIANANVLNATIEEIATIASTERFEERLFQ